MIFDTYAQVEKAALGVAVLLALQWVPHRHQAQVDHSVRVSHARELLGKHYERSVVRRGEKFESVYDFVYRTTHRSLKGKWKKKSRLIADTLIDEANKHQFDPLFLMAVIKRESSFDPLAKGGAGEIGLMQILPKTGRWIANMNQIPWSGKRTLRDPVANIKIGAAFFKLLQKEFDSYGRFYLAAYNMGQSNVRSALRRKIKPRVYPREVMEHYVDFYSKLKKRRAKNGLRRLAETVDRLVKLGKEHPELAKFKSLTNPTKVD